MFLLSETDCSVTDICFDVGFTSSGTFSRAFREILGETPSDYRVGRADGGAQLLPDGGHAAGGGGGGRDAIEQF
jgi:AraC-like DNA-binding protein